jgi:hypothetical protein
MPKLFLVLLGCRPDGRNTEQHDVFFGVGETLAELVPQMKAFWLGTKLHVDAYWAIEQVGEYGVTVQDTSDNREVTIPLSLFFINLGAYRPPDFEEYHKKIVIVAKDIGEAVRIAKQDEFYQAGQSLGESARSHVDDKFEIDDLIEIQLLLPRHTIRVQHGEATHPAEMHIGYIPFSRLLAQP